MNSERVMYLLGEASGRISRIIYELNRAGVIKKDTLWDDSIKSVEKLLNQILEEMTGENPSDGDRASSSGSEPG